MSEWTLVWADEFNGALDTSSWSTTFYDGERHGYDCTPDSGTELEYYTDEDVYTEDGYLRLRAQDREYVVGPETWHYTSGIVSSHLKRYWPLESHRFEARIRMPEGYNGFWPAFWLCVNPDPHVWPPEVDIMEQFSLDNGYYSTWDYPEPPDTPNYVGGDMIPVTHVSDWHTYGVECVSGTLTFTLDGTAIRSTTDHVAANHGYAFYILLNLAVDGGTLNPPHHAPDENTVFPAYMDIDWVRVYETMAVVAEVTLESNTLTGQADSFDSTTGAGFSVSADAAMAGSSYGMAVAITTTANRFAVKGISAPASGKLRLRFYFDPNSLTMADNDSFEMHQARLSGAPYSLSACSITRTGGAYVLSFDPQNDAGWFYVAGNTVAISDGPHYIETYFTRAATNVSADGTASCWVDGVLLKAVTGIDNYDAFALLSAIWLGPDYALDAGTSGTLYYDELLVNDDGSEIGEASYGFGSVFADRRPTIHFIEYDSPAQIPANLRAVAVITCTEDTIPAGIRAVSGIAYAEGDTIPDGAPVWGCVVYATPEDAPANLLKVAVPS